MTTRDRNGTAARASRTLTLFLCGNVMTGRGIDQILPYPGDPQLFESYMRSAVAYVELAERSAGPIPRAAGFDYVWGDALAELERVRPQVRIANLETAVTVSEEAWPRKGIHYRMHPANVPCLTAARIDCCALANNHVLDWGHPGLAQTLTTLHQAGIRTAGAGADAAEAGAPAVIDLSGVRVLVFAVGTQDSGVPREWQATQKRPGVNWLGDLSAGSADAMARRIARHRRNGGIVVVSIHWGGNWGFEIQPHARDFAHRLIDTAGVDLVHGHSSHHVKGIEVYRNKAILYGCGDFLNDYEGIGGYDSFRADLGLMYFATLDAHSGDLLRLAMTPTRTHRFRIQRASAQDVSWLAATMNRECGALGAQVARQPDGTLALQWGAQDADAPRRV